MADIHVSFDIETLHTRPDGVILSIAAAARVDGEVATFYSHCNIESQTARVVSDDTVAWWKKNPDLFAKTLTECKEAPDLSEVLGHLTVWYGSLGTDKDRLYPWGNGANFDIAFLEHAYSQCGYEPPWAFWMARDLRTVKHVAIEIGGHEPVKRVGTHHDARDDAITQLLEIENCMGVIYGSADTTTV
jgi:hypothetical protein